VELLPLAMRQRGTQEIINSLRPQTEKLEPAFIYYEEPEEIGTKEILLELYGYDYDILKAQAIEVAKRVQTIPKFTDTKIRMREGRPELNLIIDKKQAAYFGLTVEDISLALHTHMRGLVATHYRGLHQKGPFMRTRESTLVGPKPTYSLSEGEMKRIPPTSASPNAPVEETESIVRLEERYRKDFDDLRRISFVTPEKEQVYLSQLATFKFDTGPSEIWRKNKSRMVQVSANTGGVALGTAADKVKGVLKDFKMPKDYFWQFGGNYDKMVRNQSELTFALIISLVLVYMILASLFESFTQPFIILFTVPLAAIGAVWALRMTDKPVGIGALVGGIMLGGIVVNNAIVLIDRINFLLDKKHLRGSRAAVKEAVVIASADRLRPIMMTSLTTILGLIPMAFDKSEYANLWCPLAITVIGGMSISTILTLLVIPGVYLIFRDLRLVKR
jgi:HAE1 family hydrophobic/amphiphilic exporter-1